MKTARRLLLFVLVVIGVAVLVPASTQAQETGDQLPVELVPNVPLHSSSMALSPDGNRLVTGESDGSVKLWDFATGRLLRVFLRHSKQVTSVIFLSDGKQVLSASEDMTIKLWDAATGKLLRTTELRSPAEYWWDLKLSPDGSRALSGQSVKGTDNVGIMKLWDVATGQVLRTFRVDADAVAFSPDGARLLSGGGGKGGQIKLWDATTGRLLQTFNGHRAFTSVSRVAFSPDGSRVLSSASDHTDKLWDVASGRVLQTFEHTEDRRDAIAFSPDGMRVMTGDFKGTIRLWDAATGRLLRAFEKKSAVDVILFLPDGARALTSSRRLELLDVATGNSVRVFGVSNNFFSAAVFSTDGDHILSGGGALRRWDAKTGQLLSELAAPAADTYTATFSPDGTRVLWIMADQKVLKLIDATTGRLLSTFEGHGDRMPYNALSPDGTRVISGGGSYGEKTIKLWDASTGRLLRTFAQEQVIALAFSPDGTRILSGNFDKTMKLWDAGSGQLLRTFTHAYPVWSVAFSPDGTRVMAGDTGNRVGDAGNKVSLWDVATGRLLRTFEGHTGPIFHGVAFSPDGARALSASNDKTVKLWDTATGRLICSFDAAAHAPAFSPDGTRALFGGAVWNLDTGERIVRIFKSQDNEWLTITPEGFFAASEKGADILSIVRGFDVWSIDQFYQSLYRPDLVRQKLAGDPRGLVREAAAQLDITKVVASGNAPAVRVVSPAAGTSATSAQITAEVEIEARGGGVGRIEWRVNGLTVGVEAPASQSPAGQSIRLTRNLALDAGDNIIEVVAYNSTNLIASVPARVTVGAQVTAAAPVPGAVSIKPRLFVLAAGLNDYADGRFKLAYSVQDAKAMAQAFVVSGKGLYDSVEVKVMSDTDVTRDKLDTAFNELAGRITPSDTFVLYLAGHGKTVDGRYYFIPQNFKVDGEATAPKVDAAVKSQGIAQEQWQRWFAQVPAKKSMILFDTCESGTLTGDESETKTLERGSANDRLAQATGRSIITASTGSTEAFEGYNGHGLFTYNILDALDHGDGDNNGTIEVTELAAYVYAQVTSISERVYKQRQEPQMKITLNYALTRQAHVLQDAVPAIAMDNKPTYQLAQTAQLQIRPSNGATVVRSLSPKTAVTVLKSEGGWSLIASEGRQLGYVATRDLAPMQ